MDDLDLLRARADADPPPLGPFRTFQVPITGIADRTALDLQQLADLDRFPVSSTAPDDAARWRRLTTPADISWQSSPTG